ncbi:PREDICTED: smoothelin-like protein 1 [Elephantulus edwardii]|uniref:smoothelin-like protein 1 n=1 Tax=Elephantulus edwardii TaxID=28737 RepID=UPI0003F0E71F|nr:PREDICTED: smoothelin-like protein 1 [Elephantulus edwardii]
MDHKEGKPSADETNVSPTTEDSGTPGNGASEEEAAKDTAGETVKDGSPDGAGKSESTPAEGSVTAGFQGEANGLDEVKVKSKVEDTAELEKEGGGSEESTGVSQEKTDEKGEAESELKKPEGKEEAMLAPEKQKSEEKEAKPGSETQKSEEKVDKPGSREEADVEDQAARLAPQEASDQLEQPEPKPEEEAGVKEDKTEPQQTAVVNDEAKIGPQEADGKEETKKDSKEEVSEEGEEEEPGGNSERQAQDVEREPEEGAQVVPSSPEEWPESPTEEGQGLSPDEMSRDTEASGETSPSASESSPSDVPQSPTEPSPPEEKKKEKAPERRVTAPTRPRGVRAQNRKAIVDKFGGAASGPTALFRNTKAAGVAIGGVKQMLLEWCRAMTKKYEHVDIQNFSSSWSSGMAFCALIHKFFPDAFDYAALDPTQRRHNFTLAFSTAEKLADCAQLLEVDDMVRLAVPDSKCVYTYIQELYRSLVEKGLVKTKKK